MSDELEKEIDQYGVTGSIRLRIAMKLAKAAAWLIPDAHVELIEREILIAVAERKGIDCSTDADCDENEVW